MAHSARTSLAARLSIALFSTALLMGAPDAAALQAPAAAPGATAPAAAPALQPLRVGPLTIAGSVRARAEGWGWFSTPGFDDEYAFGATLVRAAVTYSRPQIDATVEVAQPFLFGLPENAVAAAPQGQLGLGAAYRASSGSDEASLFLKQAFVRISLPGAPGRFLRAGRFEFLDGTETTPPDPSLAWLKRERVAHRLLGNFGFTHVGRSFDAVHAAYGTPGWNVTFFGGVPTEGVFQLDASSRLSDMDVEYGSATIPIPSGEVRAFVARYQDGRGLAPVDNRSAPVRSGDLDPITVFTGGGHLLRVAPIGGGTADVLLWGAYQWGEWGSQNHSASALAAEAGYQPSLPLRPWVRIGYFLGSGDGSPEATSGGTHETFFQMLPTPRIYARTPIYNLMNSRDLFAQVILRPDPRTTVRLDFHSVDLAEAADLWYAGGGAFSEGVFGYAGRPSAGSRDLASVLDASIDRQIGSRASATFYVGRVNGGEIVSSVYPDGANGYYAYLEMTARF